MTVPKNRLGFIGTIEDDDEIPHYSESSESDEEATVVKKPSKLKKKKVANINLLTVAEEFDDDFVFDGQQLNKEMALPDVALKSKGHDSTSLDEKILQARKRTKMAEMEEKASGSSDDWTSDEEATKSDFIRFHSNQAKRLKRSEQMEEESERQKEKITYSEEVTSFDKNQSFQDMNLSRPLIKGLATLDFSRPTPIQSATIPVALMGRDICACATTGSGKTAAFMLPILERLLYKPKQAATTRVLVLTPTRELAVQIYNVSKKLSQFTNATVTLSAGGLDIKSQEATLRLSPDIVIATPGRLIDHVLNAPGFHLNDIEILVLDEADRMLDEYFAQQMREVLRLTAKKRQTLLFSATMTEEVEALAAVSLKSPIRVFVSENTDVNATLRQEFVRIREKREGDREAVVAALVKRNFLNRTIVFVQTKLQAHRMHILLGLLGLKVAELHGNLTQTQRLEALKNFRDCRTDILIATDLASRGLDIQGVKTVINLTMPLSMKLYIHRVGRTARAGKQGRAVTLVGEKERRVLREVLKSARRQVKNRVVPQEVIDYFNQRIEELEKEITQIMKEEKVEREMAATENQLNRASRLLHDKKSEEADRGWFQTQQERKQDAANLRLGGETSADKVKSAETRMNYEIQKAIAYAKREARRGRPAAAPHKTKNKRKNEDTNKKKNEDTNNKTNKDTNNKTNKDTNKKTLKNRKGRVESYDDELTNVSSRAVKAFRARSSAMRKAGGKLRKK